VRESEETAEAEAKQVTQEGRDHWAADIYVELARREVERV
jgi:hypothetical protein